MAIEYMKTQVEDLKISTIELLEEVKEECIPPPLTEGTMKKIKHYVKRWTHIPYLPAFHRPGWLLRYIVGPYDLQWIEGIITDFIAGLTVALTLIPQGLSYAVLANLPPINGLYCAILPSAAYTFFGSSMPLGVGPVAVVSLMVGEIIAELVPDFADDPQAAIDCAAQIALCCGIILTAMSILNMGDFIRYISFPVMSGFTSGAACQIGLSQLKSAIGSLISIPQTGQTFMGKKYEYNYEVMQYIEDHWYDKDPKYGLNIQNPYACKICFGLYIPLLFVVLLKGWIKSTPERKKNIFFRLWMFVSNLFPFFAILIGCRVAKDIILGSDYPASKSADDIYAYKLDVIKDVPSGLNILRSPNLNFSMGEIFQKSIALTLIAYMESWSVARKLADMRGELPFLNASQEMWANGVANLLASVSSSYPVSGSFSRSSLNHNAGAKTPLSKLTTMIIIVIVVTSSKITSSMYYIPKAALSAIIFASIYNLIDFEDLWEAWKHSKKDFITMLATWICVLTFNTEIGLAVGVGSSILMFLADVAFNKENEPLLIQQARENGGIDVVRLEGDLNFVTVGRFKWFISTLVNVEHKHVSKESSLSLRLFAKVNVFLDKWLAPKKIPTVEMLPKAIVVDLAKVKILDLSGLVGLDEVGRELRNRGVLVAFINTTEYINDMLTKYKLKNDQSQGDIDLEPYLTNSHLAVQPTKQRISDTNLDETGDEQL